MRIKKGLLIGLVLTGFYSIDQCMAAQTAAEVVFYHHRTLTHDNSVQQNNFPLYPVGDEVPNLPKTIAKEETDLKLIQKYYSDVANAFFAAAEQLEEKTGTDLEKIKKQQRQVSWKMVRTGEKSNLMRPVDTESRNNGIDPHLDKAQRVSLTHKGFTYTNSLKDANEMRCKGEFYSELADTAQQLKEGIMQ